MTSMTINMTSSSFSNMRYEKDVATVKECLSTSEDLRGDLATIRCFHDFDSVHLFYISSFVFALKSPTS